MANADRPISWFLSRDGRQHGPISDAEMRILVAQGHLRETDYVWREGFDDWRPPSMVFRQAAPLRPPPPPRQSGPAASQSADPASTLPEEGRGTSLLGVKVVGAVGVAAVAATLAFYAEAISKVHDAVCRVMPAIGLPAERLGCSADGQRVAKIEKGVERVEESVKEASKGIGRLEVDTGVIKEAAKATDERTQVIDQKVDAINKANDPGVIARQKITTAGYSFDNAGYIKAVAQGSEAAGYFKDLGIHGDAAALRQALLASKVASNEYKALAAFLATAHSEHYASSVREEIKGLFAGLMEKQTIGPLRKMACETGGKGFIDQLVRANLASHCKDETRWLQRSLEFAQNSLLPLQDVESYMWWTVNAPRAITYRPTTIAARTVTLADLVSEAQRGYQRTKDEYLQADVTMSLRQEATAAAIDIFDPAKGTLALPLFFDDKALNLKQHPCWRKAPTSFNLHEQAAAMKPTCTARVTVHAPRQAALKLLAVENVRPLGAGTASRAKTQ